MTERGGPQPIPRPDRAVPGRPAPWAHVDDPAVGIDQIEARLARRGRGRAVGQPPESDGKRSAVLVPLYEHGSETWVILTRRSSAMRAHTGEVAFPGGRIDPTDADEWAAALREAHEEVALDPDLPTRIGELDSFVTGGSSSFVTPLVGRLPHRPRLTPNEAEVDEILHVSLAELMLPEVYREEIWTTGHRTRPISFFELHGDTVWGATAAMLRQLLAIAVGADEGLLR